MTRRNPLDFDVSVSGSKRRTSRKRGMSGAVGSGARVCEWEGCNQPGTYRAPKSREQLDEFRWFCLDHVREYNKNWNYYAEMNGGGDRRQSWSATDQPWGRPTWRARAPEPDGDESAGEPHADGEAWRRFGFEDPIAGSRRERHA